MKSDIVLIDNRGNGFAQALEQTRKAAVFRGISHQDSTRLQLIAEEMLSLARSVTGEMQASFWIDNEGRRFELNMETNTVMDKEKRYLLISSTTAHKNAAANSFLGKLRDAFESAMTAEKDYENFELPSDLQADLAGRVFESPDWDRYEQSVLFRLADSVSISIRGGKVNMTVVKSFKL